MTITGETSSSESNATESNVTELKSTRARARVKAPEPTPFKPGSILWDTVGLHTSVLAANSAFVLQVMHPSIGTVVDQRSRFRVDPVGRAARSFASVQTWIYGGEEAIAEGLRLREMHKPLSAVDEEGRTHHALSADPWAWVHLTGYYASVTAVRYFAPAPFTPEEEQQLFDEFMHLGRILRVPERMLPKSIPDYWAYFADMVENTLVPHRVAHDVLDMLERVPPGTPALLRPLAAAAGLTGGRLIRFITVGTLPPAARDKLGLPWTPADDRRLRAVCRTIAITTARLPERLRYMPIAYRAREAARARQRLDRALANRPL